MTAPRKQVAPGTRDARTGAYIRKPVRVQGSRGGSGGKKGGCALTLRIIRRLRHAPP